MSTTVVTATKDTRAGAAHGAPPGFVGHRPRPRSKGKQICEEGRSHPGMTPPSTCSGVLNQHYFLAVAQSVSIIQHHPSVVAWRAWPGGTFLQVVARIQHQGGAEGDETPLLAASSPPPAWSVAVADVASRTPAEVGSNTTTRGPNVC